MKHELQAIVGPIGSGFDEFVKVYGSSLPDMIDFDNSSTATAIYDRVRDRFGAEWWNVPDACIAKDLMVRDFVCSRPTLQTQKEVFLTTEPSFIHLDGNLVGVLPIPSDIVLKLRREAKTKVLPVHIIGTGMTLYESYRSLFLTRKMRYFQTVTEAYQSLQSLQSYAV
jgi:hypothetical protein